MTEVWREVKGFEGLYEVSNCGRVKSLNYHLTGQTRLLKPCNSAHGYLRVFLSKDGRMTGKLVHRLVAEAFLENPLNFPEVNHKDEVKTSNFVFIGEDRKAVLAKSNLEWCDHKYNINFGTRNERHAKAMKDKLVNHQKMSKRVLQYDIEGNLVQEWPSAQEVKRKTGWDVGNISSACHGKLKTAYGFVWRYAAE